MINFAVSLLILAPFAMSQGRSLEALEFLREQGTKVLDFSRRVIDLGAASPLPRARNSVRFFRVAYGTQDGNGKRVRASGLLVLPGGGTPPRGIVSFQHGTAFQKTEVPSRSHQDPSAIASAIAFGSQGLAVALPDYLGLGESPGFHPFLDAKTEASASRDMLIASGEALASLGLQPKGTPLKLFLAGYSQGGHATLALEQALERRPISNLQLTAVAPMAGPYDLSGTTVTAFCENPTPARLMFVVYLVKSLRETSGGAFKTQGIFLPSKMPEIDAFFAGRSDHLQDSPPDLFEASFIASVKSDPSHPLRRALRQNDVYDFKPVVPVRFFHASGDQLIPFANAEVAARRMQELGGEATVSDLGAGLDHAEAFAPAVAEAAAWFETFLK